MARDIEEVIRIIAEKNPKTIDELYSMVQEEVKNLPFFKDNQDKMVQMRGSMLEASIQVEVVFNEIILRTNVPSKVTDTFQKKSDFIKSLMKSVDFERNKFTKEFFKKMDTFVLIRNLFAHVPNNKFSEKLIFDNAPHFSGFFKQRTDLVDVSSAIKEGISIGQEILPMFVDFIKLVQKQIEENREFMKIIEEITNNSEKED